MQHPAARMLALAAPWLVLATALAGKGEEASNALMAGGIGSPSPNNASAWETITHSIEQFGHVNFLLKLVLGELGTRHALHPFVPVKHLPRGHAPTVSSRLACFCLNSSAFSPYRIFSAVKGVEFSRTPVASYTAFAIAARMPDTRPSPTSFVR